jgi:hypothetical protein
MKSIRIHQYFIPLLVAGAMLGGCTTHIKPSLETNPSPAEKFSAFGRFELRPLQAGSTEVASQGKAMAKIEEHVQEHLGKRLAELNAKPLKAPARTLVIEPTVTELKFVSGAKRFFAGALAGSSAVILKAKFTEKETGKPIANPEFYAKASAMSGAYSVGGNDNGMLGRIANWLAVYVLQNYKQAVGGAVVSADVPASSISLDE